MRALKNINDVDGRFISSATNFWWAYRIALEFPGLNPHEVKKWAADQILETLAAIGLVEKSKPKPKKG